MKKLFILMLSFTFAAAGYAQEVTTEKLDAYYQGVFKNLHKRAYTGQYELPKLPKATPELMRKAHNAAGAPLNFTDRIWSPGEWEEVKAIVVSPLYAHFHPEHMADPHYSASPMVPGYGAYYYKQNLDDPEDGKFLGYGQYISFIDVQSELGQIFLYIIDAIQMGGAEAWVRIESSDDAYILRNAMKTKGLATDNIRFFVAPGNAYWFRDCGPICFYYGDDDNLAMLDFFYGASRCADDVVPSVLHREMGIPNYISSIIWEGGNCLVDGVGTLITSESTFKHNATDAGPIIWDGENYSSISETTRIIPTEEDITEALQGTLGQNKLIFVPALKSDGGTGHVDLYADAKDENGFLFTKMPEAYNTWKDYATVENNISTIFAQNSVIWERNYYDMGSLPFPSKDDGTNFESEEEYGSKYSRSYANHCIVNNVIIQPCFSPVGYDHMPTAEWDRNNIKLMQERYPGYTFYCVDMRKFDGQGGSIHCVTKQIPADNPVRILHKNIHGSVNAGTLTEIPFRAIITNKSGIANAQLIYRVDGGDWQTVELKNDGNSWYASVPISTFTLGSNVDYYFSATSNNDKTITKPINAAYGAFFTFNLTNEGEYDETMFDFDTKPMAKELITFTLDTKYLREDTSGSPATAISEVNTDNVKKADNSWYTIGGSRLSGRPSAKGIYIYNGKKVAVK